MSYDPQWSHFQPPTAMNSSTSDVFNFKNQGHSEYNNSSYSSPAPFMRPVIGSGGYPSSSATSSSSSRFPTIGTFSTTDVFNGASSDNMFGGRSPPNSTTNNTSNNYGDSAGNNQNIRETGIIEKLLHSYGFIQCCDRQARLFFHFSQFNGNIEHLKIGDPVEFEMTYDRRTGKPIASAVTKIAPEVVLSEERVMGIVTTELSQPPESQGRISYENRGECFFLPYNKDDVEGNVTLRSGDKVSFQIATNQRSGNLAARNVRLENPAHPVRYQGVVCSMKESFGFIERADVVKEIFFHFSEAKGLKEELALGDDVEFTIQTRNGKEVACNITRLESGSVIFEDVGTELISGQVLKPLERNLARHQNDPLPGRIRYRAPDHKEVDIQFGDKDQQGDFTLRHGDWVEFCVATDRRDGLQRATKIKILPESFNVSGEKREQGIVVNLKDGFGFINCADRDARMFFHLNEMLDIDRVLRIGDEVEFTVAQDLSQPGRQSATRILMLPSGTVQFELIVQRDLNGVVTKDAPNITSWQPRSPSKSEKNQPEAGQISYTVESEKKVVSYFAKDCHDIKNIPRLNDKVRFNIAQVKRNKELLGVDVQITQKASPTKNNVAANSNSNVSNGPALSPLGPVGSQCQGWLAAIKDGFGFIEASTHDREVFFHFSNYDRDPTTLEVGAEVEFTLGARNTSNGSCVSAENVRVLAKGTIVVAEIEPDVRNGKVVRSLRAANPEQAEYAGLVREVLDEEDSEESVGSEFEFGISSLQNKRELLQNGDAVTFQVDADNRATNIVAVRKKLRAVVDTMKGQFGFLNHEMEDGKKLFFRTSEVAENVTLQPGDTVEFVLVTNQRTGKSSACSLVRVADARRPERMMSKLRSISLDEAGPKVVTIRQPKGPDASSKGFSSEARTPRKPGFVPIIEEEKIEEVK
ncbi:cold shock domain-containing protein E1 isoform X2 [Cloeon dipterum]|uniref:cold shock domain-containing protein E1 isoform X2 n=1 Tax=Cloeon dipterum TaxID=197152 RepID=UPI0032202238